MKLSKTQWGLVALGIIAVVALGSVGALPSYSFVSVRGSDGNLTVQKAGFGDTGIRVKTGSADIRVNSP